MRRGGDCRGNVHDRWRRREWLLSEAAGFGGDSETVPCYWCGCSLQEPEADRYPVSGQDGGRYVRGNIVPACRRCNARHRKREGGVPGDYCDSDARQAESETRRMPTPSLATLRRRK